MILVLALVVLIILSLQLVLVHTGTRGMGKVRLMKWLTAVLFFVAGPLRIQGRKNIPKTGGVLLVLNHQSVIDPVIAQHGCPRFIHYMSRSELFQRKNYWSRFFTWLITLYGAFPVKRWSADFRAIRMAIRLLREGKVVLIFPEGDVNRTPEQLMHFRKGAAFIARFTGVPVICGAIINSGAVWPAADHIVPAKLFGRLHIIWGQPKTYPWQIPSTSKKMTSELVIRDIEASVRTLLHGASSTRYAV